MGDLIEHVVFGQSFFVGRLPADLARSGQEQFESFWELHPREFHTITQPFTGKTIPLPRWQQAYGRDYRYTGSVNRALPVPAVLEPLVVWAQKEFDKRLNGLLLNWYDGEQRHYIGPHRDSTVGLVVGTPIVTMSLGATRNFRLRPMKEKGSLGFPATHGTVFIMPWETNLKTKHEVPYQKSAKGRRISITLRAFEG